MFDSAESAPASRILIIDDEVQIRRFLRISLASQGYEVLEAADAGKGLKLAATRTPELIVLDLGLPDMDGREVLEEIRSWSAVPVIILSVRADEHEKVRVLDAGANDYVTKPFGMQEFLARVRNLLRVQTPDEQDAGWYDDGYLTVDLVQRRVAVQGDYIRLTRKEFRLLRILFLHQGCVVTHGQLLRAIWGPTHTADTHYLRIIVGRLRQKLGDDPSKPRYLFTESGVGYRFVAQGSEP
ncbi:MAG: response regulator [Gammaproteobacteria bacterium]|nr:response regulator [Gammaproteobacteria bacterium]